MSHPTSQLSDCLHFLRLSELLLQVLAFRDILSRTYVMRDLAFGVPHRKSTVQDPPKRSIWPNDSILMFEEFSVLLRIQHSQHALAVVLMYGFDEGLWVLAQAFR